ncbi:MAG: ATP-grasp domain-containing protein [Planctomycetes bacterium]|nr:ATP-grasp domain-containing protein [Planctomycetota bacterium]
MTAPKKRKASAAAEAEKPRTIRAILIPNRGEIALRIVRTARALGLRVVVAHSEADADSLAVRLADGAVLLGPTPAPESYLSIDRILEAARRAGADAIHPGYGFLSEREPFARAVEESGLKFIGPSPENIRFMGDKVAARRALHEAGIPIVPGERDRISAPERLEKLARKIGLPLLLKAAAGGGGKGIRLVRDLESLESAFRLASSEALNAFGDPSVYAERYLEKARHVEVQVVGDGRGGARLFPERDCSTQRRHQKLLEETPCPALSARQREELLRHALKIVQLSRYRGAGTLEFLFDGREFYFLEMNTRLQVEHPITEMLCGVDLVAEQIAVTEGKAFGGRKLEQAFQYGRGAAMEFRINAEDPELDFLPSTGTLARVRLPSGPGIRVDSAAFEGWQITPYYDSLIAKVIAWGEDRAQACRRLRAACEETVIAGVATTLPVALALLGDVDFLAARNHCQFLEERLKRPGYLTPPPDEALAGALAIAAAYLHQQKGRLAALPPAAGAAREAPAEDLSPWGRLGRAFSLRGGA